jgi:glycosyltransferase involved in cell wall biosynthesis
MATITNFRAGALLPQTYAGSQECASDDNGISYEFPVVDLVVNIATSGRPDLLRRTLKSLGECELPPGYSQTIVVENGPRAGAEEIVRSASRKLRAQYIHFPRGNKSAALNEALKFIHDSLVFYTDDDVRFDRRVLREYADAARYYGGGCFYGGPLGVDYVSPPPNWLREYLPCSAKGWKLENGKQRLSSERFIGCNWAAYSEDLRALGGFNPQRGPGSPTGSTGQETDMQDRLLRSGLSGIYVPGAYIWHFVPENRCSPDWVIQRNYSHGLEDGARAIGDGASYKMPPWWISYRYVKGVLRAGMWSISSDPQLQFRAKNRRSYDRGLIRGVLTRIEAGKNASRPLSNAA